MRVDTVFQTPNPFGPLDGYQDDASATRVPQAIVNAAPPPAPAPLVLVAPVVTAANPVNHNSKRCSLFRVCSVIGIIAVAAMSAVSLEPFKATEMPRDNQVATITPGNNTHIHLTHNIVPQETVDSPAFHKFLRSAGKDINDISKISNKDVRIIYGKIRIRPQAMSAPLMWGKDQLGRLFIAVKHKDKGSRKTTIGMLTQENPKRDIWVGRNVKFFGFPAHEAYGMEQFGQLSRKLSNDAVDDHLVTQYF